VSIGAEYSLEVRSKFLIRQNFINGRSTEMLRQRELSEGIGYLGVYLPFK